MATAISLENTASTTSNSQSGFSIPPKVTLRGKRLVLKPPTPEDDGPLCTIFSDLITVEYLPQYHRPNGWTLGEISELRQEHEDQYLQGKRIRFDIHVLEKTASGGEVSTVAGLAGYRLNGDGMGEFGIILHRPFWRRGFNAEATYMLLKYGFETLALKNVDWITRQDNTPMRAWCESLGMVAYEVSILDMGESVGYSMASTEWRSRVRHLLEQRLGWSEVQLICE